MAVELEKERKCSDILKRNLAIIGILVGAFLVSITIYPFYNLDTKWEYDATLGVLRWGMPYVITYGNIMNQPPLGFYFQAAFCFLIGQSTATGTLLVTLFGVLSTFLVYKIGLELYGKISGLLAAVLFAFAPWQIIISRSYLIDVQCLSFSLLACYLGIKAAKNNSKKFALLSGLSFTAAFLTKLYAVYALLPLVCFFLYYQRKETLLSKSSKILLFALPFLICSYIWYIQILGFESMRIFYHSDFFDTNPSGIVPSLFFVSTFLINYGLGYFFVSAIVFSIAFSIITAKINLQNLRTDGIFLFSIFIILFVD